MKNTATIPAENFESTYGLIVRSEERGRSAFEAAVYALFIVCAVFSIWQSAQQSIVIPSETVQSASYAGRAALQTQGS